MNHYKEEEEAEEEEEEEEEEKEEVEKDKNNTCTLITRNISEGFKDLGIFNDSHS